MSQHTLDRNPFMPRTHVGTPAAEPSRTASPFKGVSRPKVAPTIQFERTLIEQAAINRLDASIGNMADAQAFETVLNSYVAQRLRWYEQGGIDGATVLADIKRVNALAAMLIKHLPEDM